MAENEVVDQVMEESERSRLNARVAICVSILATIMALGKVKDNNTVLNIQRTQTERVNQWGYYQAKGLKENLADAMVEQLTLALVTTPGDKQTTHTARIDHFTAERARYRSQKEEIQKKAEALAEEQEALIKRHDMFDLSEAAFSIALAVFALTALTQKKWLLGFGLVFGAIGLLYFAAGFAGWNISPGFIAHLLG